MPQEAISNSLFDTYKSPSKADILQIRRERSESNDVTKVEVREPEELCQDIKPNYRTPVRFSLTITAPKNDITSGGDL